MTAPQPGAPPATAPRPWVANVGEGMVEHGPAPGHAPEQRVFNDDDPVLVCAGWSALPPNDLPTVIVSITDKEERRARLPKGWHDMLRMSFQDFDPVGHYAKAPPASAVLFTATMAARLARFARRHRGCNILVHCAAGISRSGAVVEALLEVFPEYEDRGWPRHPNTHVKVLLKRALGLVPIGYDEPRHEPAHNPAIQFTADEPADGYIPEVPE